jgi:hypothetical protein
MIHRSVARASRRGSPCGGDTTLASKTIDIVAIVDIATVAIAIRVAIVRILIVVAAARGVDQLRARRHHVGDCIRQLRSISVHCQPIRAHRRLICLHDGALCMHGRPLCVQRGGATIQRDRTLIQRRQ